MGCGERQPCPQCEALNQAAAWRACRSATYSCGLHRGGLAKTLERREGHGGRRCEHG
jgi:hypothetical protein